MAPHAQKSPHVWAVVDFERQDALEHLGQVAQIESVVALGWRWRHFRRNLLVNVNAAVNSGLDQRLDFSRKYREVAV